MRKARDAAVGLLITFVLLCVLEGLASVLFALRQRPGPLVVAERLHTEHDPLLGWINRPNMFVPNMYGPERYMRTNSQRLRSNYDFEIGVPPGRSRWLCTGDSFTLGYGVDNEHAWCALLAALAPSIEPVNMGQGGYGIDQAFLWYERDGARLQHDVLLFAFVTMDLARMGSCEFFGHPKPCLTVQEGRIVRNNVPVPHPDPTKRDLPRYLELIESFRTTWLVRRLIGKVGLASLWADDEQLHELAIAIFTQLNELTGERGAKMVLVHLPVEEDYGSDQSTSFRSLLASLSHERDWFYLDLIEDLRGLRSGAVPELFIQRDVAGFSGSKHHYTERGNRFIAESLLGKVRRDPLLSPLPAS